MKLMKTVIVVMVFAITMMIGSIEVRMPISMGLAGLGFDTLPVSITVNEARADDSSSRRVARRTARRTSRRN